MAKTRRTRRSGTSAKAASETRAGWLKIGGVVIAVALVAAAYVTIVRNSKSLDEVTLCPTTPSSVTVLLVDVTDPMTTAQRQDFQNQLTRLRKSIPRHGKLIVTKVDSVSDKLLQPVIIRCNPGTAEDVSQWTGDPKGVQRKHDEGFVKALDMAFSQLGQATGAERSPIFESVQSVALTELATPDVVDLPRKLVLVSDLLQNTDGISFYSGVPDADQLLASAAFRRVRTDLKGIDVEIWMLERVDAPKTQPRALIELWDRAIVKQGGTVARAYNVSG